MVGHGLLASAARLAGDGRPGPTAPHLARSARGRQADRLVPQAWDQRQHFGEPAIERRADPAKRSIRPERASTLTE